LQTPSLPVLTLSNSNSSRRVNKSCQLLVFLLNHQPSAMAVLLQLQKAVTQAPVLTMQQQQGARMACKQWIVQNQQQPLVTVTHSFLRQILHRSSSSTPPQQWLLWSRTQQVPQLSTSAQQMWLSQHSSSSKLCPSPLLSSSSNSSRVSHH
jgi:hypothetical protein